MQGSWSSALKQTMLWWLYRLFASRHHRLHATCHTVMAAGMGVMLVLMNG